MNNYEPSWLADWRKRRAWWDGFIRGLLVGLGIAAMIMLTGKIAGAEGVCPPGYEQARQPGPQGWPRHGCYPIGFDYDAANDRILKCSWKFHAVPFGEAEKWSADNPGWEPMNPVWAIEPYRMISEMKILIIFKKQECR